MDTSSDSLFPEVRGSKPEIDDFLEKNEKAREELRNLVSSKQAFLLVGAGSSKRLKFPLWSEFLANFYGGLDSTEQAAVRQELTSLFGGDDVGNLPPVSDLVDRFPLQFASALESASAGRHMHNFRQYLGDTFGRETLPSPEHQSLLRIPFRGILTTNYDLLLEGNLDVAFGSLREGKIYGRCMDLELDRDNLFRFLFPPSLESQSRIILHLHGTCRAPQRCVISLQDYEWAYPTDFPKAPPEKDSAGFPLWFLNSIAGMQRMVFLGFSYNDLFMQRVIRRCCESLWLDGKPMHYLISGVSPETVGQKILQARELIGQGIQLVCFEEEKGTFASFTKAIEFLGGKLSQPGEGSSSRPGPAGPVEAARAFADKDKKSL
jgi:hypothetical protein